MLLFVIEILCICMAVGAIASLARGRGANPILWGTIAVVGYFAWPFATAVVLAILKVRESIVPLVVAWMWFGALALFLRYGIGTRFAQPDTDWFCANCKTYNKKSAVMCDACKQTWESQQKTSAASAW